MGTEPGSDGFEHGQNSFKEGVWWGLPWQAATISQAALSAGFWEDHPYKEPELLGSKRPEVGSIRILSLPKPVLLRSYVECWDNNPS